MSATRHAVAGIALATFASLVLHWPILETFRVALVVLAFAEGLDFARRVLIHFEGGARRVRGREVLEIVTKLTILGVGVWVLGMG